MQAFTAHVQGAASVPQIWCWYCETYSWVCSAGPVSFCYVCMGEIHSGPKCWNSGTNLWPLHSKQKFTEPLPRRPSCRSRRTLLTKAFYLKNTIGYLVLRRHLFRVIIFCWRGSLTSGMSGRTTHAQCLSVAELQRRCTVQNQTVSLFRDGQRSFYIRDWFTFVQGWTLINPENI